MAQKYEIFYNNLLFVVAEAGGYTYDEYIVFPIEAEEYEDFKSYLELVQSHPHKKGIVFLSQKPGDMMVRFLRDFVDVKAAGGLVVNEQSELLLIKRNGVWDLPKGKVEKGEFLRQAALREVKEETGLQQLKISHTVKPTFHIYPLEEEFVLKTTYWYYMNGKSSDNLLAEEKEGITEIKWVAKSDLKQYVDKTYPNIKLLLALFSG